MYPDCETILMQMKQPWLEFLSEESFPGQINLQLNNKSSDHAYLAFFILIKLSLIIQSTYLRITFPI